MTRQRPASPASESESVLTPEVQAMIGVTGEMLDGGVVDKEYLRRFIQAVMDPDPRYWDETWARYNTRFGRTVTPPIMVSYGGNARRPMGGPDEVTEMFQENFYSDGTTARGERGGLPRIPTKLVRHLNAGNDIEVLSYPAIGDRIKSQQRYSKIVEHVGKDGTRFLVVTRETRFWNQDDRLLCITRGSSIVR